MDSETPAPQAEWHSWAWHPNHGPLIWRTEGVEHRPTHKEVALQHWEQVPSKWQKGYALYDPDYDALYLHSREGDVPEDVAKTFRKWYPKLDPQTTSYEHLAQWPDMPGRYSNRRFSRAMPNWRRYAADVRELAAKMVHKLKHRPDLQKLRDEAMAASSGINAVTDDGERAQRWQIMARWEIIRDALTMLAAQYPESFKLFPWAITKLKKATIPPEAKLDAPEGPRIGVEEWADVPLSHIVDEIGQAGKMLNEMRQQNRIPEGFDVNQMTLLELSRWKQEQMAALAGEQWENEEKVHEFEDGWYIASVKGQADMAREGELMGHCVGGYCEMVESGDSIIYSLRDPRGLPHATIELGPLRDFHAREEVSLGNPETGRGYMDYEERRVPAGKAQAVRQVQGKSDSVPIPEYLERIKEWLDAYQQEKGIRLVYTGQMGENVYGEDHEVNDLDDLDTFWEQFQEDPQLFLGGGDGRILETKYLSPSAYTSDLTEELGLSKGEEVGGRQVITDFDEILQQVLDSESRQSPRWNYWTERPEEKAKALYALLLASGGAGYDVPIAVRPDEPGYEHAEPALRHDPSIRVRRERRFIEPHNVHERAEHHLMDWQEQESHYLWDSLMDEDWQDRMADENSNYVYDHSEELALPYGHAAHDEDADEINMDLLREEELESARAEYEDHKMEAQQQILDENSQYKDVYRITQPLYQLGTWIGELPIRPRYDDREGMKAWAQNIPHPAEWDKALDTDAVNEAFSWRQKNPEPYPFEGIRRIAASDWLRRELEKREEKRYQGHEDHGDERLPESSQDQSTDGHLPDQRAGQNTKTEGHEEGQSRTGDSHHDHLAWDRDTEHGEHLLVGSHLGWSKHAHSVTAEADHSGAMIALYVPHEQAQNLALPMEDAESADDLHITLAYFVDKAKDRDDWEVARRVAAEVAREHPSLKGEISGFGKFKNGDGPVLWASVDVPGLDKLRVDLVEKLEGAGFEISNEHGFTPHVTLLYGEAEEPEGQIGTKLEFDHIVSVVNNEREEHELSAEARVATSLTWSSR